MKNIFKIALMLMISTLFIQSSIAVTLTKEELKTRIEKEIIKELETEVKGDIKVDITQIPVSSLSLKEGNVSYQVNLNTNHLSSRTITRVSVLVDGEIQKTMGIPIELSVKDYVYVALEPIKRGSCLNSSNIELVKKDITQSASSVITKKTNLSEYVATRNIRSGDLITRNYIKPKPDVKKNSMVSVIFRTKGVNIAIDAQAMADGVIGDYIKVKSQRYRRYYTGKVVSKNKVIVYI